MKKSTKVIIIVVAVALVLAFVLGGTYNGFLKSEENLKSAQSTISVQLQRRADLIPNFVETVKGYSDYEKSTFTAVTEARTALQNANSVGEQAEASGQLDGAISVWVNAITEAYPELKANEQYKALQYELAGTENRIAVARKDYNDAAKAYNVKVKRFPGNIIARLMGFEAAEYFETDPANQEAPQVAF